MGLRTWSRVSGVVSGNARYTGGFEWQVTNSDADRIANNRSIVLLRMWGACSQPQYGAWNYDDQTSYFEYDCGNRLNIATRYDWRNAAANTIYYVGTHTSVFPKGSEREITIYHGTNGRRDLPLKTYFYGANTSVFLSVTTEQTVSLPQIIRTHPAPTSLVFNAPVYGSNRDLSFTKQADVNHVLEYQLNGGSWVSETTISGNSYTVPSARFNGMGTIRFRIKAVAVDGWYESAWAYTATQTIQKADRSAPSAPTASNVTDSSVTITGAAETLVRNGVSGTGQNTPFNATGLTRNTAYNFYAYFAETSTHKQSPNSAVCSVTTLKTTLAAPEITSVSAVHKGVANCVWSAVTNATGYSVDYSINNGSTWVVLSENVSSTSVSLDHNLSYNQATHIRFRVRALGNSNFIPSAYTLSTNTEIQKATQSAPSAPTIVEVTENSITVNSTHTTVLGARQGDGLYTFDNLIPETSYSLYSYKKGDKWYLDSPNSPTVVVTTLSDLSGIFLGEIDVDNVRLGSSEVDKMFVGGVEVWKNS